MVLRHFLIQNHGSMKIFSLKNFDNLFYKVIVTIIREQTIFFSGTNQNMWVISPVNQITHHGQLYSGNHKLMTQVNRK